MVSPGLACLCACNACYPACAARADLVFLFFMPPDVAPGGDQRFGPVAPRDANGYRKVFHEDVRRRHECPRNAIRKARRMQQRDRAAVAVAERLDAPVVPHCCGESIVRLRH
jgi:hypothetical protein